MANEKYYLLDRLPVFKIDWVKEKENLGLCKHVSLISSQLFFKDRTLRQAQRHHSR